MLQNNINKITCSKITIREKHAVHKEVLQPSSQNCWPHGNVDKSRKVCRVKNAWK